MWKYKQSKFINTHKISVACPIINNTKKVSGGYEKNVKLYEEKVSIERLQILMLSVICGFDQLHVNNT